MITAFNLRERPSAAQGLFWWILTTVCSGTKWIPWWLNQRTWNLVACNEKVLWGTCLLSSLRSNARQIANRTKRQSASDFASKGMICRSMWRKCGVLSFWSVIPQPHYLSRRSSCQKKSSNPHKRIKIFGWQTASFREVCCRMFWPFRIRRRKEDMHVIALGVLQEILSGGAF